MTATPRQSIIVHYRKLEDATGAFSKQTLEAAIRKAMKHHSDGDQIMGHWKLRAWGVPPSAEDTLLMNLHQDGGEYFFGDLTQYTKGYMQTLIEQKDDMPFLPVEQQPAPQGKEYVHSMMYWLVAGNHVLLIQSRSLNAKHLEEYLTWLLKDRTPTIATTAHIMLQAKFDAAQVGGDLSDIQEIIVGGRADIHALPQPDDSATERTVQSYREVTTKKPWKQRAIEVLRAVMANEADVQKLLESIPQDADLQVAVHIGYKASRKVSRAPMQQALRHLPEGEITARGRDGKITGSDIRLHHAVNILKNGSLLDANDVVRALRRLISILSTTAKYKHPVSVVRAVRKIAKIWDFALALVIGGTAARFLPQPSLQDITTEVIAFFAIQSAVILPAMIFTAGLLRGDGVSISEARQFHRALRLQMRFWVTLLALDFVAVCLLIIGKAVEWKVSFDIIAYHLKAHFNFGPVLVGTTCFVVALCVFRMIPFVRGVMSLLEMNGSLVEKSIIAREKQSAKPLELPQQQPLDMPPGYGQIKHH